MTVKSKAARAAETEAPPPMPSEETEAASTPEVPGPVVTTGSPEDKRPDLIDRLRKRHMPTGNDALKSGEIIKRRKLSFDVDGADCEPDMFTNEEGEYVTFRVTLQSLSSAQELEAVRGLKDGTQAPLNMCRLSLFAINGKTLSEENRDFYWECLGSGGRQICMGFFSQLGAASESAMGKSLRSRSED